VAVALSTELSGELGVGDRRAVSIQNPSRFHPVGPGFLGVVIVRFPLKKLPPGIHTIPWPGAAWRLAPAGGGGRSGGRGQKDGVC